MAYKIEDALSHINIADHLDEDLLDRIGHTLADLVENDDDSRQEWLQDQDEWLKLAAQVRDLKTYPWTRASNVKFPLVTIAALQFHARALPGLINSTNPVRARVIGDDPEGVKQARSTRVETYMSYQLLEEMEEWLDEVDRMMMVLPIIGMCYKKSYYSENLGRNKSVLVLPRELILNYHAKDYQRARMSHVMLMDQNELKELQNREVFLDVDLQEEFKQVEGVRDQTVGLHHGQDAGEDPYEIVESHCWWDLDDDGYKEPYIITYHRDSRKVLRIVARWAEDGIEYGEEGKIIRIEAEEFFTPFVFLPDPNSAVYGLGFGRLLGPTNEAVNTLINQLIDAGTLSNMQTGFLTRGAGLKGGAVRFQPGEWKIVNTTGDDLRKGIVPLPSKEPSNVLQSLLGLLVDYGQRLSAISDIMVGENPGQNQPATTTMAVLEQGLKVFTGIYKRIHRSLAKEYQKLYKLNARYLDEDHYRMVLDKVNQISGEMEEATVADFEMSSFDISPASDPNFVSDSQKAMKAQALLEKAAAGFPINVQEALKMSLQAEGQENIEALMTLPEQGPSIEEKQFELDLVKTQIEALKVNFDGIKKIADAEAAEAGVQLSQYKSFMDTQFGSIDRIMQALDAASTQQDGQNPQQV